MKTITRLLATAALLFGVLGGVSSVKAAKAIGTKYTSVAQLSGKAFAIVNETEGKAIYHKGSPSPFTLGYDVYSTAFSVTDTGYKFIIEQVNDPNDAAANGKYLLRCVKEDGSVYDNNYFQTNSSDESFIFALNFGGSQRGLDGANTAVWDIEYNAIAGGWSLKNVGKNGYLNDPTKGATNATPAYFTFCEVKDAVVPFDQNVEINGRNYQLYVPSTVTTNCPLVISLHGANGSSAGKTPFKTTVADEVGCIVVYPQGLSTAFPIGFGGSATGWTASGEHNFDVEFLEAVIEDVASKYIIDRKRIYCCGFSNGGMMTYAMANACSDKIAAFASISGFPLNEFHLRHAGERPVPFLHIHGKNDGFVKYVKMPTIVDEMVARLGANPVPTKTYGNGYTKSVYAAADGSFPYVYYEIDGMDHSDYTTSTEDGSSAKTMWNFFKEYTLDSPCDKTLKWAPRIDENGYTPAEHGWTVNTGTTLLQFGGDYQYTADNMNVYHSLQFNSGSYKLSFKSTGEEGKTIGVKLEKLTSPNTVVLNKTVNVGEDAELPFDVADDWGEYKLTMTRPAAGDNITIKDLVVTQTSNEAPVASSHYRLYAKSFSTSGTNITYADGKLKWTATGNNVAGAITADPGVIAKFASIHFTCSGLTDGATYRVMLTTSSGDNYLTEINATGDVTVNFADLNKQWTNSVKLTPEILEAVTQVRIGGGTGGSPTAENPYEMTLDVSSFYIESEEDYLPIANAADWDIFSKMVKAGVAPLDAQLTADVDAGSAMVGTSANPYQGTFDGAGHTLTFTYDGTEQFAAPFQFVNTATISDLKTTGSITTTNNQCGGIIGKNTGGNTTLNRCMSSATVTCNAASNGRVGGLAGRCTDGTLTFNYCMFDGAIHSTGSNQYAAGFVGYKDNGERVFVNHSLVASTIITGGGENFASGYGDTSITDSYYLNKFGSSGQGTQMTDQLRYSGQAAYTLNQGIGNGALFFGQGKLNSSIVEETPSLTADASKKVYKAANEALYANANGLLPDPALSEKLAWKMAMTWDPIYFVTLPAASASSFELYGSSDAYILRMTNAEMTTLVVPFNVAENNIPGGLKVYDLTFDGTKITATKVNSITANKPVLITGDAGEYILSSGLDYNVNIDFSSYGTPTNGALTGVYCTDGIPFKTVPVDAYILQARPDGVGFYKVAEGGPIRITSFRAYLTASSSARSLPIVYSDDEATGIGAALNDNGQMINDNVYNLCGQRVEKPTKGLYIKNGKKVIMK